MEQPRILVAGIGNIFLGDDAFGSEVARFLAGRPLPAETRVVDFGIKGFDLVYALLDRPELTILIDATRNGGEPGTLYVIEPEPGEADAVDPREMMIETHGMNPMKVISLAKAMSGELGRIVLVGCEPASFGSDDGQMGLSEPVRAAVERAARLIESLITANLTGETRGPVSDSIETGTH